MNANVLAAARAQMLYIAELHPRIFSASNRLGYSTNINRWQTKFSHTCCVNSASPREEPLCGLRKQTNRLLIQKLASKHNTLTNSNFQTFANRRTFFTSSQLFARKRDFYEVLGVASNSDAKTIKKAYYEKAKKYHPDSNKDDPKAAQKFQEVSEAYEVLSDPAKRQSYNLGSSSGTSSSSGGFQGFTGGAGAPGWQYQTSHKGANPFGGPFTTSEDYFRQIFEEFETKFGTEYRQGTYQNDPSATWTFGEQSEVTLDVGFKEAALGCDKEVNINCADSCTSCMGSCCEPGHKPVKCPYCQGTGTETISTGPFLLRSTCRACKGSRMHISKPCKACQGKGKTLQRKRVSVPVPAGVTDGQTLRMRINSGSDLYVTFKVQKSTYFRRDDADVHTDAVISISQAILGGVVRIEGLYEDLSVTVNPGTSSHSRIRLPQKGFKRLDSYGRGDHYVHVKIQVPQKTTKRQKDLIREFALASDDESDFGTVDGVN